MLIYKQRYKPRTSRAFTKSDLTVYDSAGNTALNALTVYGKSEVVDGVIKSAGEGWSVVRLADLTWSYNTSRQYFSANITAIAINADNKINGTCSTYTADTIDNIYRMTAENKSIGVSRSMIFIIDTDYTTVTDFVASLGDATLCYKLEDPSQGNTIAIKTDNGTGIDGTMAVFETGTPLYGVSDTIKDAMVWDGSAGEVTKKCSKKRLANITNWSIQTAFNIFSAEISDIYLPTSATNRNHLLCSKYISYRGYIDETMPDQSISTANGHIYIKDTDYTTVSDFVASLGDAELIYELATPTTQNLTSTENDSIAGLRTFTPQTHAQNNAQTDMTVDYTIRVPTI